MRKYYTMYREIAERIGVSLAGEENRAKAFGPCTRGEVLGLNYNTQSWKCWLPREKSTRLLRELYEILEDGGASNRDWMKVNGKINHYHPLLRNGKYNRTLIQHAVKPEQSLKARIELKPETKIQIIWWILNLRVLGSEGGEIMDPKAHLPARAVDLHGDAAGGATSDKLKGWGVCCLETKEWRRRTWPKFILNNIKIKGIQYGRKLTMLEGFTSLQAAYSWAKQGQRQGGMSINCDNIGFYWAYKNGSSRDEYVWTLAKALNDLADGLGIKIQVFYQRRRTDLGDQIVDHLSKGEMTQVEALWPEGMEWSGEESRVLKTWIERPRVMIDLGRKLLEEMRNDLVVHVGCDYRKLNVRTEEVLGAAKKARVV